MAIRIPLKLKYRNPNRKPQPPAANVALPPEAWIWTAQKFRLNSGQPGNGRGPTIDKGNKRKTVRPRKKAYGPF